MTRAIGIDISYYDKTFNPTPLVEFVTMRASYGGYAGGTWKDNLFDEFYPQSLKVPVRGVYHYFSSHSNWKEQADKFLEIVSGKQLDYYACDIEIYYNDMTKGFILGAFDWMDYIKSNTTTKVILYSNPNVYNNWITPYAKTRAPQYDLWIAQYYNNWGNYLTIPPCMPTGRTDWHMWQFMPGEWGKFGKETGVGRDGVDMNVFNGSLDDMKTWLGIKRNVIAEFLERRKLGLQEKRRTENKIGTS